MKKKNDTPQSPCYFTCPKTGTSKTGFVQVKIMKELAWINRKFSKFGFWTSRWKKLRQRQHTVKTVPKSNQKILKEAILILLTHVYMTAHFPGTSLKVAGLNLFNWYICQNTNSGIILLRAVLELNVWEGQAAASFY